MIQNDSKYVKFYKIKMFVVYKSKFKIKRSKIINIVTNIKKYGKFENLFNQWYINYK